MLHDNITGKLYLSYEGPFSIQIISSLARLVRENIPGPELAKQKVYRVFIELAQNVSLYSMERISIANNHYSEVGFGKIYITDEGDKFLCTTVNKILNEHGPVLDTNCKEINGSSVAELKIKKKALRKIADFKDTGAHIGLIMICINSGNPLKYDFFDNVDKYKYFRISASIYKNDNFIESIKPL